MFINLELDSTVTINILQGPFPKYCANFTLLYRLANIYSYNTNKIVSFNLATHRTTYFISRSSSVTRASHSEAITKAFGHRLHFTRH